MHKKFLFSCEELAEIFGVSRQAVSKWKIQSVGIDKKRGRLFYLPDVVAYKEQAQKRRQLALDQERAKLAKEQTRKVRLEARYLKIKVEETERTMIKVEEVKRIWSQIGCHFKTRLLSICSTLVVVLGLSKENEEILKKYINEALEVLSVSPLEMGKTDETEEIESTDGGDSKNILLLSCSPKENDC